MPMDEVYTLAQIKEHWEEYKAKQAWRVLRDGKWVIKMKAPEPGKEAMTRCEMVKLKDYVSFPKFLEAFKNA